MEEQGKAMEDERSDEAKEEGREGLGMGRNE